ncbi:MAG: PEP/pyruvate-binding domain-containing protein, partial [Patescibacteria group bacterium]
MKKEDSWILWYENISIADVSRVGGKNAAIGEMYSSLSPLGIKIPNGFAVSASGYHHFLEKADLKEKIKNILSDLDTKSIRNLQERGKKVRELILRADLPHDLAEEIAKAYQQLCGKYQDRNLDVAIRSSATAEDLPGASFAGQQESYLNIRGPRAVLSATKKCMASLFTDRAISYRVDKGFSHFDVGLSVGIQRMIRSDLAASGVIFTLDTETGFDRVIIINGIYGLGELIVQGKVKPEEYLVFKPSLKEGHRAIIERSLGLKDKKLVYSLFGTRIKSVSPEDQKKYSLTDDEVLTLAQWSLSIEEHFSQKHNRYQPMDIEWAKDGKSHELFI